MQEADALFEEAEHRQRQEDPNNTYLYSLRGFHYASFLLRNSAVSALPELNERVQVTLKIAEHLGSLLDISLDRLNLACIAALEGDENVSAQFDAAIVALRKAGLRDHIPRGYLARAGFRRTQGDLTGAKEDLAEVRNIGEPAGMRLYLCDALIEETWLHHLGGEEEKAQAAFNEAKKEVITMGYHWQDEEFAKLRDALG